MSAASASAEQRQPRRRRRISSSLTAAALGVSVLLALMLLAAGPAPVDAQCVGKWFNSVANGQAFCRGYPLYPYGEAASMDQLCYKGLGRTINAFVNVDTSTAGPGASAIKWLFYGTAYTQFFINSNFLLSFTQAVPSWGPYPFPSGQGALLSPYWAHTDNRAAGGNCTYRIATSGYTLSNCTNDVNKNYLLGQASFTATACLVVTWDNHPLFGYGTTAPYDTVQLVLATDNTVTYALFNYGRYTQGGAGQQWRSQSTVMASQNGYPQVGFDSGDGARYYSYNASYTADMLNILSQSNTRPTLIPGRIIFRVSDSTIVDPPVFLSANANITQIATTPSFALSPTFNSSNVGPYSIYVNASQQLTIAANLSDPNGAALFIDGSRKGSGVSSGVYTISSTQVVSLAVIAADGTTKTYTLNFMIIQSPIAGLSAMSISGMSYDSPVTSFTQSVYGYVINLASTGSAQSVRLLCTSLQSQGTIKMGLYGPVTGSMDVSGIALNYPSNTVFNVISTSEDGTNVLNYNITFNLVLSQVTTLFSFVSSPAFTWTTQGTTLSTSVSPSTTQLVVTATTSFVAATARFSGGSAARNVQVATLPLGFFTNTFQLTVTAENTAFSTVYTISVYRPPSTNANVTSITVTTGLGVVFTLPLSSFAATAVESGSGANASYAAQVTVTPQTPSVTLTPVLSDAVYGSAKLGLNGATLNTGLPSTTQTLNTDPFTGAVTGYVVYVTAQDGVTVNTFRVNITKPAVPTTTLSATGTCNSYTDVFYTIETKAVRVILPTPTPAGTSTSLVADCVVNKTGEAARLWFSKSALPNFATGTFVSSSVAVTASDTYSMTAVAFAQSSGYAGANTDWYLTYAASASATATAYALTCNICISPITPLALYTNTTATVTRNRWAFYSAATPSWMNAAAVRFDLSPQLQPTQGINTQYFRTYAAGASTGVQATPTDVTTLLGGTYVSGANPTSGTNQYTQSVLAPGPSAYVLYGVYAVSDGVSNIQTTNTYTLIAQPPVPVITLASPVTGPTIGGPALAVTLTVTNAEPIGASVSSTLWVTIGGKNCTAYAYDSQGRIQCTPPAGEGAGNAFQLSLYYRASPPFALTYAYTAPSITAVSPSNGPTLGSTSIVITGSNLGQTATVTVGGKSCSVTGRTTTTITCTTQAGEGVALVLVTAASQTSALTPLYFTFDRPQPITYLSPYTGTAGVTATANALIIWGTNFGSPTASVSVTVGGAAATVASWNQTVIVCNSVPAGSGTTNQIVVTVSTRVSTAAVYFAYAAPTLTLIAPNPVPFGTNALVLTGTNFGPSSNAAFNSINALGGLCTLVSVNSTFIVCTPPARTAGLPTAPFVVINGQASNSLSGFGWVAPQINTLSSFYGDAAGTTALTLLGVGFSGVDTSVKLNGATCTLQGAANDTALGIIMPAGSGLNVPLQVYVGGVFSNIVYVNYTRPTISSVTFTPSGSPATDGSSTAIISGVSFSGTTGVVTVVSSAQNTVSTCTSPSWSTTQISCSFPAGTGPVSIVVTVGGQSSLPYAVTYAAPTFTSLNPSTGVTTAGGTLLQINGGNFGASQPTGATVVFFLKSGAVPCTSYSSWSNTAIGCIVPAGNGTGITVTVTIATGVSVSTNTFSYLAPAVTAVTSTGNSFPTAGAVTITITGTSLDSGGTVLVNGTLCTPILTWVNGAPGTITCTLPVGGGVSQLVQVRGVGGQNSPSTVGAAGAGSLTYDRPVIGLASPNPSSAGQSVTLVGINFGNNMLLASVSVGSDAGTITFLNQTACVFTLSKAPASSTPVITYTYAGQSGTITAGVTPPFISSLNPTHGPTGPAYNLTLNGLNFGDGSQTTSVTVSTRTCVVLSIAANGQSIVCRMPLGGTNAQAVQVTVGSQPSNTLNFQYDAPFINWVSPNTGLDTAGSQLITVAGASFSSNPSISIGGTSCLTVTPLNDTMAVCSTPSLVGTALSVVLTAGAQSSNTNVTVAYAFPVLTSLTPTTDSPVGGSNLVLTGTGFGPGGSMAGTITVGGVSCPVASGSGSYSPTSVTCVLPAGSGAVSVIIRVNGVNSNAQTFTYFAPVITSVTAQGGPSAPQTAGGTTVVISGQYFSATVGSVSINTTYSCVVTQSSQWTTNAITCTMPALAGTVSVVVTAGGQPSNTFYVTYAAPAITSISPANGPTVGGTTVFITGTNLFTSGVATIGGFTCTPSGTKWTNTRVECTTPAGVGDAQQVKVTVFGQSATFASFTYNAPTITQIVPSFGPTNALRPSSAQVAFPIAIYGTNFGLQNSGQVVVQFGGSACSVTFQNQTYIACASVPNGVGTGVTVRVAVVSQFATTTTLYAYTAPTLTSITSSSCTTSGNTVVDCPINGGVLLTLNGANFGYTAAATASSPSVSVNNVAAACTTPTYTNEDGNQITCTLPSGLSFNIPVTITVGGQTSNALNIAYAGPTLGFGSLRVLENDGATVTPANLYGQGSVVLPDIDGSALLYFNGTFLSPWYPANPTPLGIKFGTPGVAPAAKEFSCTITTYDNTNVRCTVQGYPIGQYLTFVYNDGNQWSRDSVDTITWPTPSLMPGTIASPGNSVAAHLAGSSNQGEFVQFDAKFVGNDASLLQVWYGYAGTNFTAAGYQCTSVSIATAYNPSTDVTRLQCRTSPGTGGNFVFKVVALNLWSAEGADTYAYPQPPVVYAVFGCPQDSASTNSTSYCPTTGGTSITLIGTAFSAVGATAKVGTSDCIITSITSQQIVCTLPAGTGANVAVSVFAANLLSAPVYLLSYQSAYIQAVKGCTNNAVDGSTSDCSRTGNTLITVVGQSFGGSGAQVFIGASACTSVVHDSTLPQQQVTCYTPHGVDASAAVLLLQSSGALSNNTGLLGYAQCPKGYYQANSTDYACTPCAPGSYTDQTGSLQCTSCPIGRAQPSYGLSTCSQCATGSYTPSVGYSTCQNCTAGQVAGSAGQAGCVSCGAGTYSPTAGATVCLSCPIGAAYDGTNPLGVTACANCTKGSFTSTTGRSTCSLCGVGTFNTYDGASQCASCSAGTFLGGSSGTVCSDCLIGTATGVTGTASCPACNPGRFANVTGLTACLVCGAGTFSGTPGTVTACTACSAGSYQPASGQGQCLTCSAGSFSSSSGATQCTPCALGTAGTPAPGTGLTACGNCTTGYAAPSTGQGACTQCAAGFFSYPAVNGAQSACIPCGAGSFSPFPGATTCLSCGVAPSALGTYNANSGQSSCALCDIGFFGATTGLTECGRCAAGRYSGALGSAGCTDCGSGYITNADAQPLAGCVACAAGSFSSAAVSTVCTPCSAGQSTNGVTGAAGCTDCLAGQVATATGSKVCTDCGAGYFANTTGLSTCSPCAAGSYSSTGGASPGPTSCTVCAAGQYAPNSASATCADCPAGSFSNTTGSSACLLCEAGSWQDNAQQTSCKPCAAGSAIGSSGAATCTGCSAGSYADVAGMTACVSCPAGSTASSGNAQTCTNCTAGSYAQSPGSAGCTDCSVGSIAANGGATTCVACSAGTVQPNPHGSVCNPCLAGQFQGSSGFGVCSDCALGGYSNTTSLTACYQCDIGTYAGNPAMTTCTSCGQGRYAASAGLSACVDCSIGTYAPPPASGNAGASTCLQCDAGTYQDTAFASSCKTCPAGAFCIAGATTFTPCPAGQYQDQMGRSACFACPLGNYCPQGSTVYLNCSGGAYSASTGASVCVDCAPGSFSNTSAATECSQCIPGYATQSTGSTACAACTAGQISYGFGGVTCTDCSAGTYSPSAGQSRCAQCDAATAQPLPGKSSCTPCIDGWYAPSPGAAACFQCPVGSFAANGGLGSSACTPCSAGKVAASAGSSSCTECLKNTYVSNSGQAACIQCGSGTFANTTGLTGCYLCGPGSYSQKDGAGNGVSTCTQCDVGTFSNGNGFSACLSCGLGTATNAQGQTTCGLCAPHQAQSQTGQVKCVDCLPGTFASDNGTIQCVNCPSGSVQPNGGQESCLPCDAGKYQSTDGQTDCVPCDQGKYMASPGAVTCTACPLGQAQPQTGQQACVPCDRGSANNVAGRSACAQCTPGTFTDSTNQVTCQACSAGTISVGYGNVTCRACGTGTFAPNSGLSACQLCGIGKSAPAPGQSACTPCQAGTYTHLNGTDNCFPCGIGSYSNDVGFTVCSTCSAGYWQNGYGQTACSPCAAGTFNNGTGFTDCYSCEPGTYSANPASTTCLRCVTGTNQPNPRGTTCSNCNPGTYSNTDVTTCTPCPPGFYQDSFTSSECLPCDEGHVAPNQQTVTCAPCQAGQYMPTEGNTTCLACPIGTYMPSPGASVCLDCVVGTYGPEVSGSIGLLECLACSGGTFSNDTKLTACYGCDPGQHQAQQSQTSCALCGVGTFTDVPNQAQCQSCGGGRFAANNGSTTCLVCGTDTPLGTYNSDATGHSQCYACPVGTFSTGTSVSACSQCAPGSFSNVTGQTVCVSCQPGQYQLSAGETACTECALGSYNPAPGASVCKDCLIGYMCNTTSMLVPFACQFSQFQNAPGKSACQDCLAGSFSAATASSSCTACSPGQFDPKNGTTACGACSAGTYQNAYSGTECLQCDTGRFSADGAPQCTLCAAGTYANVTGLTTCAGCPQGRYQDAPGMSECWACQPGRANSNTGRASCDACNAGSYTNGTGSLACTDCPAGSSQPQSGQPNCTVCDLGKAQADAGQALCTPCGGGSFANVTGLTVCQQCLGGTYQDQPATTVCKGCEIGTASVQSGLSICPACGVGTYTNVTGKLVCDDCAPGTYQDTAGMTSCVPCQMGTFSVAPHASACTDCSAGTYSDTLSAPACTGCTSGLYQPYPRATACLKCGNGTYSTGINIKDCTLCSAGTYANDTGLPECTACGSGTFQANPGMSACDLCQPGKSVSGTGAQICVDCEQGKFANVSGALSCTACLPGSATSRTASITCDLCFVGHQQPSSGAFSCDPCSSGTYTSINGTTLCAPCDKGTAEPQPGATSCATCLPGSYADVQDLSNCKPCPAGAFSNTTGMTDCFACAPGRAAPNTGSSTCAACGAGTATTLSRQAACQSCAPGSFTNVTGALTCTACPLGTAQQATGRTRCDKCSAGGFADVSGLSVCKSCPQGQAVNTTGATACIPCAASTYAPTTGYSVCDPCPAATYAEGTGQASCTPCQPGRYANTSGHAQCVFCGPGTYQPNGGNNTCLPCELGTSFAGTGAQVCTFCSAGAFANITGLQTCVLCPGGKYQVDQGSTVCTDCPWGTTSPAAGGATQCTPCQPGTYTLGGQVLCSACPNGQYQPQPQQSACLNCTTGYFSGGTGARQCSECTFGRFTTVNGSAACDFCQPGYYQDQTGKTDCKFCPIASYSAQPGAATCRPCDPGSFGNATLTATCYACPKGQYQSLYGQQNCTDCGVGKFLDRQGGQSCDLCPAGTYTAINGTIVCTPCPAGQFNPGLGVTVCQPCGQGTYSLGGAAACTQCAPGTFSTDIGRDHSCDLCDFGKSQPAPGKTNCTDCGLGVFAGVQGLAVCTPCGYGTKGNDTGLTMCVNCDIGEYQNTRGKSACSKCAVGTYSISTGQQQCINCGAGKFGNSTGATDCFYCAKGTYQDVPGKTSCPACPTGRFGTVSGEQQCSKCAPGTYGAGTGALDSCAACPVATFQDSEGAFNCTPCALGEYNDKTGQPDCVSCPTSTFGNTTGLRECYSCQPGRYQNAEGTQECELCPPGTASTAGQITCPPCGTSTATGKYGTENQCTTCQLHSQPNTIKTQCECDAGYYLPNYNNEPVWSIFECLPCPTGANCDSTGTTFSNLAAANGYWRPTNTSLTFYRCLIRSFCTGGEAVASDFSSTSGSGCTAHRQGIMCSYCEEGYRAGLGSTCTACPTGWAGYVTLALGAVALGLVFLLSMYVIAKSGHHELRMARFLDVTDQIAMTGKAGGSPTNSQVGDPDAGADAKDGKGGRAKTPRTPGVPQDEDSADEDSMSRSASKSLNSERANTAPPKSARKGKAPRTAAGERIPGPAGDSSADDAAKPAAATASKRGKAPPLALDGGAPLPGVIGKPPASGDVEMAIAPTPHGHAPMTSGPASAGAAGGAAAPASAAAAAAAADENASVPEPTAPGEQGAMMSSGVTYGRPPSAEPPLSPANKAGPAGPMESAGGAAAGPRAPGSAGLGLQSLSSQGSRGGLLSAGGGRLPPLHRGPSAAGVAAIHAAAAPSPPAPVPVSLPSVAASPDVKHGGGSDEKAPGSPDAESKPEDDDETDGEGEDASDAEAGTGAEDGDDEEGDDDDDGAAENNAKSPRFKGNYVDEEDDDDVAETNAWMQADTRKEMWDVQASADERKFAGLYKEADDPQVLRQRTIHGPPVPIGDITFKMKIFLSFLQIVTTISTSLDVQWPNTFTNIVQDLDVVNFRSLLQNVGSTDCISGVNYYVTFLIVCCTPLVVLFVLVCTYVLPLYLRLCCFRMYHANERRRSIATFYRLFLYCLFLLYPGVSSTIILHYNCIDVEGTSYLKADLRVKCGTDTWSTFALATLPLIILYPIGIPLFFGVLLRANRDKLRDPFIRAQLGFLYAGYRKHAWWFELLDVTHKLILTSLLAFLSTAAQLPTAMCVIVVYTIVMLRVSPYIRPDDDQLHLFSQVELLLFVLAGWVFYSMDVPSYSAEDDIIISVCLLVVGLLFIVLFVWQAVYAAYRTILKWYQRRQKQKAKKAAQAAAAGGGKKDGGDHKDEPEVEMVTRPPADAKASPQPGAMAAEAKSKSPSKHGRKPTATPGFASAIMKDAAATPRTAGGAAGVPPPPVPASAPRKSLKDGKQASDADASVSESEASSSSASASGTDDGAGASPAAGSAASPSAPGTADAAAAAAAAAALPDAPASAPGTAGAPAS